MRPFTERHSRSPHSHTRIPIGSPYGWRSLKKKPAFSGRNTGLPCSTQVPLERRRCCLSAGGASSASRELAAPEPDHVPFWARLVSLFSLFRVTTFSGSSHVFTISFHPGSPPPGEAGRIDVLSRFCLLTVRSGVTLSRTLRTPPFLHGARGGRILLAEQQVNSIRKKTSKPCIYKDLCNFTSHANAAAKRLRPAPPRRHKAS